MPNWKKVIVSGSDAVLNNITATGDVTVQGDIIAENYIVSSSVTYMTQSFSSGSTVFGDSLDPLDTHQFTGSLFITGITYDDTPVTDGLLAIDNATGKLYYTGSYGDASSGVTINNYGNNKLLTSDGTATGINAETDVTFNGTIFAISNAGFGHSTNTGRAIRSEDPSSANRIRIGDIDGAVNRTLLDVDDSNRKINLTTFLGNTSTTWTSYFHTGSIFLSGALTVSADDGTRHYFTGSVTATNSFITDGGNVVSRAGNIQTSDYLYHYGDLNTFIGFPSNDTVFLTAGGTNVYTMKSDRTTISVPLTASSDISASGLLYASLSYDSGDTTEGVVVYDTDKGRFFYTGSYGSGGETTLPGGDRTYVQYSGSSGFDGDSGFTYGPQTNTLRVGTSAPQSVGEGYGLQSGSHFLADNLELVSNARVVKWNPQAFQSENYVLVGFGQGGTIVTDPYSGTSYNPGDVGDWLGAADGNNQSPILSGLSGGQGNFADITGEVVNGSLKIGGVYANYRSDVGWSVYANQFTQVPGSPGITIRNGGIELFSSESYVGDPEGSGSLAAPRASASAVFTLANDSSSLLLQVGKEDLRDVMFISRSGDNPRIGIGTDNPLTNFDFKDISDSNTGTKMILRSSRPTKGGDNGDEAGKINFVIDSSSYGDIETSGSVAKILGSATSIGTDGASGKLSFEVADANNPKEDTTEVFYLKRNSTDLQNIVGVFEGSIDLNGANSSLYADKDVSVGGNVEAASGYVRADSLRIGTSNDPGGDSAIIQGNLTTRGDTTLGNSSDDTHTFTGNITASNDVSASGDIIANNGSFSGDLTVDGNITANQYIVSSSVTYMTQSFSSGSTIFGDTIDDTHLFTGSLNVTGSLTLNQGGLKVFLDSGSAFEVEEPDIDLGGRFKFSYSQGDPTLSVISRASTSTFKLVANNESGDGLTLTEDGLIQKNGTKGVVVNEDDFYPNTNNNVALGRSNRQWTDIYATGIWYGDSAHNLFSVGGDQRADGKYNGGLIYFGFAEDGAGNPFTSSLLHPDLHFFGIGSNNGGQNSLHNETPVYFKVGKSGSLSINLDQGDTGMGGDNFKFYTASAMVHVEAEPSWNMDLFRGDKTVDDIRFRVDREGNTTISGSLTASGLIYPNTDGDNGDILVTDGNGNLSFTRTTVYANVKNVHGSELVKGMPVHVTGSVGNTSEVIAASASNAATMPAHFILNETLADDAEGLAIAVGYINGVNTGDFNEGDTVYVGANGGYTNVKPTGSNLIQNLGIVDKVDASNGSGFILGAGRSNDVPNITSGYVWVGNNSSVATAVATSSLSVATASFVGSIHGGTF